MTLRLAIMISGRGSNMEALLHYAEQDDVPAEVVLVLANQDAAGLKTAEKHGVPTAQFARKDYKSKSEQEAAIIAAIDKAGVDKAGADAVFLAGYMQILSADFCAHYAGRLFNIHPSLLPRHKGLDTHAKAIAAGDQTHGCSVHLVTEEMDDGLVLAQREVDIAADDTPEHLAGRVLIEEHKLYPSLLGALASGLLTVEDGVPQMQIGVIPGRIDGLEHPIRWPII
jgi:phosphoribosylglycinamide formyltransferase-1